MPEAARRERSEPMALDSFAGSPKADRSHFPLRPILLDAARAHQEGQLEYESDGTALVRHPDLARAGWEQGLRFAPARQFPLIRATFDDLNKALSRLSNSPPAEGNRTLRDLYEEELAAYDDLAAKALADGRWEPDYGTYVVDHYRGELFLVAPERWHRLALVTSNAMLLSDPERRLPWQEVRERLESAVVGFAGVSVGGNVLEGWLREARPRQVKLADPDWVEVTNFNRGERMSLRHAVRSRAHRLDPRDPYDVPRVPKVESLAYEQLLVDPYTRFHVYSDGLTRANLDAFLLGGGGEPRLDVLVEEMDDLELKVLVRERARAHGIDVLMLSDFGHRAQAQWNHFRTDAAEPLGCGGSDEALRAALEAARSGGRAEVLRFVECLCGKEIADAALLEFWEGRGEQPTASLPQSGAIAMASGAIGGKELALHVLGHSRRPNRVTFDLLERRVDGAVEGAAR